MHDKFRYEQFFFSKFRSIDVNALELKTIGGFAALHYACLNESISIIELLLQNGADVNIKCLSTIGESALHLCCQRGLIISAKTLIKNGAAIDTVDNFGNNAAFWAVKNK